MSLLSSIQKFINELMFPGPNEVMGVTNHPVVSKLEPRFADKIMDFLGGCRKNGLDVDAVMGLRTFEEQNRLYAKGRTLAPIGKKFTVTNAPGGKSWHNYGLAVDVVFKVNGAWSWAETHDWKKLGAIGQQHGLEWGGTWASIKDRPHFQYTGGVSIKDAMAYYAEGGIERVWQEVYRK